MATWALYHTFKLKSYDSSTKINLDTGGDTLKIMLTTATHTPSASAHEFKSDLSNEVSGSNYTAGGSTLSNQVFDLATGTVTFDADDVTWLQHASGFTDARNVHIYKDTGNASTSPLIAYGVMSADKGNVDGDFTIEIADVFDGT